MKKSQENTSKSVDSNCNETSLREAQKYENK